MVNYIFNFKIQYIHHEDLMIKVFTISTDQLNI